MDHARTIKALSGCGAVTAALEVEHQAIENSLQSLSSALAAGAPLATLSELLDIVIDFCADHFRVEELEFSENGYPGADQHAAAHAKMLARLRIVRESINGGSADAVLEAGDIINNFHFHVSHYDKPAHAHILQRQIDLGLESVHLASELAHLTAKRPPNFPSSPPNSTPESEATPL